MMEKRTNIEGSDYSKLIQLMRKHGHNRDMTIETAMVEKILPTIKLKLTSDGIPLDREDLILTETIMSKITDGKIKVGDKVIVIGDENSQMYFVMDKAV